ncbi:alpha-1,2-fucosyltransferase [Amphritea opalescens]|uniref:Alpha-1,2-fucosyltransferase n=1 Tax=Amphritea opalescens TaxID=2490544 RepID=A0A430KUY9_9GAMM|nr:alpha-1,2-fucosyltransferase [Amphritea opalescens]RTE67154.1 alpha-1,2-fucosyltransferase [Amphritea opalescens]
MVIVRLIGGLGNQLFQYAYALSLVEKGYDVKLDISAFDTYTLHGGYSLNHYNKLVDNASSDEVAAMTHIGFGKKLIRQLQGKKSRPVAKEANSAFDEKMLSPEDNHYLVGYFQSERCFRKIRGELLESLVLQEPLSDYTKNTLDSINKSEVSVSIHIRRGDYVTNAEALKTHGICSLDYYQQSVGLVNSKFDNVSYYIFLMILIGLKKILLLIMLFMLMQKKNGFLAKIYF